MIDRGSTSFDDQQANAKRVRLHELVEQLPAHRLPPAQDILEALRAGNLDPAYMQQIHDFIEEYRPALEALADWNPPGVNRTRQADPVHDPLPSPDN
ncbi:MAG: hypothetical protein NTZ05_14715 [Chloroflexi bacterium]|nr:hypothetical protein [Chloroflexota bacterium]